MRVGTKSVLFGVHAFWWHPLTVLIAWHKLFGFANFWQLIAIFCHDLGYWGKPNMDGPEGETHPEGGARITLNVVYFLSYWFRRLRGEDHIQAQLYGSEDASGAMVFSLLHSRYYAFKLEEIPSNLCWADKLCVWYDPKWWYLLRAKLSGEIKEYRRNAAKCVPLYLPDSVWFDFYRKKVIKQVAGRIPATKGHHLDENIESVAE